MDQTHGHGVRLADWHRLKGAFHKGKVVEAVAERRVALGLLCAVGPQRCRAILRKREISWNPAEQTTEGLLLHAPFEAVVIGYDDEWRELILSKKAAEQGPFEKFVAVHPIGSVVEGTVEHVVPKGFILSLEGHVEGFLPVGGVPAPTSRALEVIEGVGDLLVGDTVKAVVARVESGPERRIVVDIKAYLTTLDSRAAALLSEARSRQSDRPLVTGLSPDATANDGTLRKDTLSCVLTVLVLDDMHDILSPVTWALKSRGHKVIEARSASEAREALSYAREIDVALVDLQLDGKLLRPLCEELRRRWPKVRILAFTGNLDILAPEKLEFGTLLSGVILKPVRVDTLVSYIEQRSTPPTFNRAWALDDAVRSVVAERYRDTKAESGVIRNEIFDNHLDAVTAILPGARAAVLSYCPETNEVICVRAKGLPADHFARFKGTIAFTPIGDVVAERTPRFQRVNAMEEGVNPTLRDLMGPIKAYVLVGFPLRIEARDAPLGLIVFGPEHEDGISQEKIHAIENVADSLALAIERSVIDVQLQMHQRALCAGSLVLGMTHEVRNAVQGMKAYQFQLDCLVGTTGAPAEDKRELAKTALTSMRRQIDSLGEIVETFLGIVKIETSGSCRLDEMLWNVAEMCRSAANQHNIAIDVKMPAGIKMPMVPTIMRQAFLNLVINAIQHTAVARDRNGLVVISASLGEEDAKRYIDVHVRDNGWGMHSIHKPKAFDMFFTTRRNGSGLGLYVTRLIVESVGGEVDIEETVRYVGTRFRVRVPVS